jgi:high-affinity Fe2+/Pb2+ permease
MSGAEAPAEKLKEEFEKVATSYIGRWVAAGVALAVPIITALCAWLEKEIGINLNPASLTAFITSMAAGLAIMGFKWLSNRGNWERAVIEGYHIYLTGQAATATPGKTLSATPSIPIPPPSSTPG